MLHRLALVPVLCLLALGGCATTEDAGGDPARRADPVGLRLAPTVEGVETVQLYRTGDEAALPVLGLNSGQTLSLEFDRVGDGIGGPVSVWFYHADRNWQRRLVPAEYLRGFQSDDIRDYEPSAATRVRYTHYEYRFPNAEIAFTRSGNYIVRVTEPGDERAVLFERAFFLTEQTAEVDFQIQSGLGSGLGSGFLQPVARVRPPAEFDSPIHDFDVCFARNGRFERARCAEEPTLLGASLYQFFLPRGTGFTSAGPVYELDLSLLAPGPDIAEVDFAADPYTVVLDQDDAAFGSPLFDRELLAGQTQVASVVRDATEPDVQAEYAAVTFRYVPPQARPVAGRVLLTGSFNGWALDPDFALEWRPSEGLYVGTALLKQGRYVYSYYVEDPAEQERRRRNVEVNQPSLYSAFVYVRDPAYNTDRLLAVNTLVGQ